MKQLTLLCALFLVFFSTKAQKVTVISGNEIEVPNRERFIRMLHSDANSALILEEHYKNANYLFKSEMVGTLYKYDAKCNIVFQKTLDDDLSLRYFNGLLFGFETKYSSKEKKFVIRMCEISTTDGSTKSPLKEILSINSLTKGQESFRWDAPEISSAGTLTVYVNQATEKENLLHVFRIDKSGAVTKNTIPIGDGDDLTVREEVFINEDKMIIVIKNFEYTKEKRKKKFLKDFSINVFSSKGDLLNKSSIEVKDKFITGAKFNLLDQDQILVTGFYSDDINLEYNNGFFTALADTKNGKIISTNTQPISMLSLGYAKEGDKKANRGTEGIYKFQNIIANPSGDGYIAVSENVWASDYTSTSSFNTDLSKGFIGTTTSSYYVTKSEDIFIAGLGKSGEIRWVNNISKRQEEKFRGATPGGTSFPYYSSLAVFSSPKNAYLLFNDHKKNAEITGTIEKPKDADDFEETSLNLLTIDYKTGKVSRQLIEDAGNAGLIYQPRNITSSTNSLFIPLSKLKTLGKESFKINRIVVD